MRKRFKRLIKEKSFRDLVKGYCSWREMFIILSFQEKLNKWNNLIYNMHTSYMDEWHLCTDQATEELLKRSEDTSEYLISKKPV